MVEFAELKTEYSHCLLDFINLSLNEITHSQVFARMQAIEKELKEKHNQKITITISTEEIKNGI